MKESTSSRGLISASAYARDAASNINSFQLYSGVEGRNAVIPIPMMPTRMSSLPAAAPGRGEVRDRSKDCRRRKALRLAAFFIRIGNGFRTAAVLLRYLDDGRRSAAGPYRDGPVPGP